MIACILKEKEREETRQMNDAQQIPMNTIHADCFMFHPNPSPTGGGYTLLNGNGTLLERQEILKPGVTNNELELLAVLRAAELLRPGGTILTDSQVVRTWVRKGRAKSRPDLNPHIQRCNNLVRAKKLAVRFVPRAKNLAGLYNERQLVGKAAIPARYDRLEIDRINQTPMVDLRFRDFRLLKSGRDEFSKMPLAALRETVAQDVIAAVETEFPNDEDLQARCYRWVLRGLEVEKAIRKVGTVVEVGENARKAWIKDKRRRK